MRQNPLSSRAVRDALQFAIFLFVFLLVLDRVQGEPFNLVGPLVTSLVAAPLYGVFSSRFRRGAANGT